MKKEFFFLIALMIVPGFCDSEASNDLSAYSQYLSFVLPFNVGINLTDANESVTLSFTLNGTEVLEGFVNSSLDCQMTSELSAALFSSESLENAKLLLSNEKILCVSNDEKGEIIAGTFNGVLGGKYLVVENEGLIGKIFSLLAGFFSWLINLFN
ncbi:MAG: hypothetical protein PHT91_03465 [Candidatus Nanoarchaeia archaeon]|nr:hypothetical protein [Candidatus Nanoarchaeia archaeon]MDD5053879.1 hypothetical protein [Candidatus Nanoarchaeia archaeon]MDD5499905.1 hypothetical protein [Candidatus Nanoarchaeia archaeon]